MSAILTYIIIGLGAGTAYAGISLGVVVVYKGSGIINFAAGAMAAWGAFVYYQMRETGVLWLPIPIDSAYDMGGGSYGGFPLIFFTLVTTVIFAGLVHLIGKVAFRDRSSFVAVNFVRVGFVVAAIWGVFNFVRLRTAGRLLLPMIPSSYDLGVESFLVALIASLAMAALTGFTSYYLIFRPMRSSPPLAKVVATVGLMTTLLALMTKRFGTNPKSVAPLFPNEALSIGGISVPRDRVYVAFAAVVITAALWAYFRYTRSGLATQAAAESVRNASLRGWSTDRLEASAWIIGTVVATFLVVITLPIVPISQGGHTLLIVPALACALLAKLTSVVRATAAALGLGALQSLLSYGSTKSWWPSWGQTGLTDAVPFIVVIVVLFVFGSKLPTRATLLPDPLPRVVIPRNRIAVIAPLVAIAGALVVLTEGSWRFGVITSMIVAISAMSIVLLTGLTGQISLAQAGLAGVAGFAVSKLSTHGIGFPWTILIAAVIAAIFGLIVGLPALRIRGAELAVVTLALGVAVDRFIFRNPAFTTAGGEPVPNPTVFGVDLGIRDGRNIARWQFGLLVLVVLVIVGLAVSNLIRGSMGRRFIALRGNERAATGIGVNVGANKLAAFAIAAFVAGISGSLSGYSRNVISADSFGALNNVTLLAFVYLAGITAMSGAVLAGVLAPLGFSFVLTDHLLELGSSYVLFGGIGLILTAVLNPVGIVGANREMWEKFKSRHFHRPTSEPLIDDRSKASSSERAGVERAALAANRVDRPLVLSTRELSVTYGGLRAVSDVSLELRRGEIVGLIGPNGAGKTSFMDGLTGFTKTSGRVEFRGQSIESMQAHQRVRHGMARTWQSVELFDDLTIYENMRVTREYETVRSLPLDLVHPKRSIDLGEVDRALTLLGLWDAADRYPSDLSLGQRKLAGVARALSSSPLVLLLDEPAAGLDSEESTVLGTRLCDIASAGTSILLIDHDMGLVLETCDYIYVLEFGRCIAEGTADEIRRHPDVIAAYLGSESASVAELTVTTA